MTNVPQEIRYQSIKPQGWYSRFKQWPIQPMSSNQSWNPNQIVRFLILLNQGLVDPYRSHIYIRVRMPPNNRFGCLQVDNSAQSFISQMVVSSNNVQRQRITQYDTLAAFLTDIGFSQQVCLGRQWQGLGYTNIQHGPLLGKTPTQHKTTSVNLQGVVQTVANVKTSVGSFKGWLPSQYKGSTDDCLTQSATGNLYIGGNISKAFGPGNRFYWNSSSQVQRPQTLIAQQGLMYHTRCQYTPQLSMNHYTQSTTSYSPYCYRGPANDQLQGFTSTQVRAGTSKGPRLQYKTTQAVFGGSQAVSNISKTVSYYNLAQNIGYHKPYQPLFCTGCFQPTISNTVNSCQFGYGMVSDGAIPIPQRQFMFPLLSTIIGALIPPDQFCLIPMAALNNLLVQLTLSPWGMFTSGYLDKHQLDVQGMTTQQKRSWQIVQIYWNLHIYQFQGEQIKQYINSSLTKQIAVTGSSWGLAAQYQIQTGAQVRGNWQINTTAQSLGEVVILYLDNRYMKYSFLRKQYRLSNNIRSLQFKFNTDFYPAQPITGNAGCPLYIDQSGTNTQFMMHLYQSYNYKFVTNTPIPRINSWNFALNGRLFQPSQTSSFYKMSIVGQGRTATGPAVFASQNFVNTDTALGYSWFHQNRAVGRAAFVYSFQPYGHSKNYMVGVDARNARPFQVMIDTWSQNTFPTDQTMYIFTRANCIITYSNTGINVLGR